MRYFIGSIVCIIISLSVLHASESKEVPVTKIILYKHGVGYFEHTGVVHDNEVIRLSFSSDQMNDILKSLVVLDKGGGTISEIQYDSKKPLEKLLEHYPFDLTRKRNLITLLSQIEGVKLTVFTGAESQSGMLLGMRKTSTSVDAGIIERRIIDLMTNEGDLKSYTLNDIKKIEIEDNELKEDIKEYLTVLLRYSKNEKKRVSISARGKGKRDIVIGYVLETPVWKTSYRLVIEKGAKFFFQGWAIIDNVQDENWENVSLSLVSGLPISFIQDLYNPYYKERPTISLQKEEAVVPFASKPGRIGGYALMEEDAAVMTMTARAPQLDKRVRKSLIRNMQASQEINTLSQEYGDLFEYRIPHPVSIEKNKSATVPIVTGYFEGERISLYNESKREKNPFSSVWITNSTDLTLEGGAITVFEEGVYGGEAIMDTLKPQQKSFISFAVDLGVLVNTKRKSQKRSVHQVIIEKGTLYARYMQEDIKAYIITNNSSDDKTIIVEHPIRHGWKLIEPDTVLEETDTHYRFRVEVSANKSKDFFVKEERMYYENYILTNISEKDIRIFVSKNFISNDLKNTFEKLLLLKRENESIRTKIVDVRDKIDAIFKDQQRIRDNLRALKSTPGEKKLAESYVARLNNQEETLKQLRDTLEKLLKKQIKNKREMNDIISGLQFSKKL
ncbi:hypothetical protein ACFL1T_00595 [Chlamydiota bacterium]